MYGWNAAEDSGDPDAVAALRAPCIPTPRPAQPSLWVGVPNG